jgi:hypothetical protein
MKSHPTKSAKQHPTRREGVWSTEDTPPSSSSSSSSSSSDNSSSDDDDQSHSSSSSSGDKDFDQIKEPLEDIDELVSTVDSALEDIGIEENDSTPVVANRSSNLDRRLPLRSYNRAPSRSSQLIYHGLFTSFQRHVPVQDDLKLLLKGYFLQQQRLRVSPMNNNHILVRNQEVLSWSKPVAKKSPSYGYDDNVGDDSLSSQSSYDQDITDDNYLQSIIPESLSTSCLVDPAIQGIYSSLFKSIHEICVKLSENKTLSVVDEKGSIVSSHIAQIKASSVVHIHDDIELFDWSRANSSHSLWYCHDLAQSPVLELAITKALKRSCHSHVVPKLFPKKKATTPYQFMGFVASNTKGGGRSCRISSEFICDFQNGPLK